MKNNKWKAIEFAFNAHLSQERGVMPYIFHPLKVMEQIWQWGIVDDILLSVAVLHDVAEDTEKTIEDINIQFGNEIASIVKELTFFPSEKLTKEQYINSFKTASINALIVKLADRICNVRDFMFTDTLESKYKDKYAKRYFHKADSLFQAFFDRKSEFSEKLFNNINNSYYELLNDIKDNN